MADIAICGLCGEPMPESEQIFKYHGYSGPCPKPFLTKAEIESINTGLKDVAEGRVRSIPGKLPADGEEIGTCEISPDRHHAKTRECIDWAKLPADASPSCQCGHPKHLGKCGDASCGCMCMKPVYVSQEYREALAAKGIEIEGFPAAGSEEPKLRIEAEAYGNLSGNTCCGWCNAKLHGKPIYTMPTAISDCRVLVCEKCASKRAAPVASQAPAPKKEFTEDQRLDFVWKAVAEHVGGVPNDNLGYIGTYSGMVADYALRRIDEMENQLFEMTKLCHQYQDQLWTEAKKAQAEANHE